ncbi:SAM-dependent methyltransferase [Nocardiopsis changdeensis]|uniref:SAM-dependent methyltransferase n=1 Tax=Nocardiopsis changdeensis TaxID=2831969 RepID=A0ABX8BI68_9ACTN|nr:MULTISPECIES: SAM-dependent methyltransferase [Nocardiopsis]QUX20533.1 SAM-dependent methyltransferase [Nocardiopsis changdeensis]QYX36464.1 SAM-dependent methyltransferase [Nocardiopsis sp. MT53]
MNTPPPIDTSQAHSARIWNYWLGGKDNYPADREAGDRIVAVLPEIVDIAVATRAVLVRMVTHLVREAGIDQFLDIGTGLPTANNTHEVAQREDPAARVVYVDNDPLVLTHARALLTGTPEGATDYIHADLRDPDTILDRAARTLDLKRPVAITLFGVLPFVGDDAEAKRIIDHLMGELPAGSHLAIVHSTSAVTGEAMEEAVRRWNEAGSAVYHLRTPERIRALFDGLEPVEPGVVSCPLWRPDPVEVGRAREMDEFCGMARKG